MTKERVNKSVTRKDIDKAEEILKGKVATLLMQEKLLSITLPQIEAIIEKLFYLKSSKKPN